MARLRLVLLTRAAALLLVGTASAALAGLTATVAIDHESTQAQAAGIVIDTDDPTAFDEYLL